MAIGQVGTRFLALDEGFPCAADTFMGASGSL
jgi:hypothetical protein